MNQRENIINSNRIVVKIGTTSLTYENGNLNLRRIQKLVWVLSDLMNSGKEVILVTSGAVGVGRNKLGYRSKPKTTQEKQACASIGQVILMNIYSKFFEEYGYSVGQILLTKDVIGNAYRKQNVKNTFETLIKNKILPIVNENDSISIDEIENISRFGDNDSLAAVVSIIVKADLLIILSDIDGLYDKNPRVYQDAKKLTTIMEVTDEILQYAQGVGSDFGTGGMHTKLLAAKTLMENNCSLILASGANPEVILDILSGKEEGTIFVAKTK